MQMTDTLADRIFETAHKYNRLAYMYVEYPHKSFWSPKFNARDLKRALKLQTGPFLLYVHFPFCEKQCFYCTCHTEITHDYERAKAYLNLLFHEIDLYRRYFDRHGIDPVFVEIHLGGGSPTLLQEQEFDSLVAKLGDLVDWTRVREFAIEVDPRHTNRDKLQYYRGRGINRISLGIQDFDPAVQQAINRIQSVELIASLLEPETRDLFPNGINFDVLCGLPNQTPMSMRKTFKAIVDLAPTRICLNHLHFAPEFARHQTIMIDGKNGRPTRLPNPVERKLLFQEAMAVLIENGYERTGYDHFARPEDDVAQALKANTMKWNALGVTTGAYQQVLGLGPHSTSTLSGCYAQNCYSTQAYGEYLAKDRLPTFRGKVLSQDDIIRRDVIQRIRNFSGLSFAEIEETYPIEFEHYFSAELESLTGFVQDELIEISDRSIRVTELGREFVLFVCRQFDAYAN
jgi:oxygen-independent coproporphyrinogen III oxidase